MIQILRIQILILIFVVIRPLSLMTVHSAYQPTVTDTLLSLLINLIPHKN